VLKMKKHKNELVDNPGCENCSKHCKYQKMTTVKTVVVNGKYGCNTSKGW
jgi:hypothetical protein